MFSLRATTFECASNSLLLPFQGRWKRPLFEGQVKLVFRRRAPSGFVPDWIYIYLGKPVSTLVGRAALKALRWVAYPDIEQLAPSGAISPEELLTYVDMADGLWVYEIGDLERAPVPAGLEELASDYQYIPTPNYVRLSAEGSDRLAARLGFKRGHTRKRPTNASG